MAWRGINDDGLTHSQAEVRKLFDRHFEVQASIRDVLYDNQLIVETRATRWHRLPLLEVCPKLYAETAQAGHGGDDMAAVIRALEARSGGLQ
jgi:3-hydroxyisobutyrate dehydrogenase